MIILGVDCGVTGAIASLTGDGEFISVYDVPMIESCRLKWVDAAAVDEILTLVVSRANSIRAGSGLAIRAYVELTHAMPKTGSVAAHSQGMTLGSMLCALQSRGVSIELVTPAAWKRFFGLVAKGDTSYRERKAASLSRARIYYPMAKLDRVKDHNRAEALLIAKYGWSRDRGTTRVAPEPVSI